MKKKSILLTIGILTLITGCNSNEKETIKDIAKIKYDGNELVYECSKEEISNLKKSVKIVVKENQTFTVIDTDKNNQSYKKGSHELKGNPKAEKCYFVDNTPIENNKYGTMTPIKKSHQEYGIVSISMYGKFSYRITDVIKFSEVYKEEDAYTEMMRTYLMNYYSVYVSNVEYNDVIKETKMAQEILNKVNKDIEKYGLEITESNIEGFEVKTNSGEIIFKK